MNLGIHYLAEFFNCDRPKLNDIGFIEKILLDAAALCDVTIIKHFFHQYSPQGVSGIIMIAESHFAIHTWPEKGYAAVDIFSCSDADFKSALNYLKRHLNAGSCSTSRVRRGVITDHGDPRPAVWEEADI